MVTTANAEGESQGREKSRKEESQKIFHHGDGMKDRNRDCDHVARWL